MIRRRHEINQLETYTRRQAHEGIIASQGALACACLYLTFTRLLVVLQNALMKTTRVLYTAKKEDFFPTVAELLAEGDFIVYAANEVEKVLLIRYIV